MSGLPCCKLFVFAALNLTDLVLTWVVLRLAEGRACESNPLACWWLDRFGWPGLAGFKGATALMVTAVTVVVSRHHPRVGSRLLTFGCSTLLAVVLYSISLVYWVGTGDDSAEADELQQIQQTRRNLERVRVRKCAYDALLDGLAKDLIERRRALAEAVRALAEAEHVQDPGWLRRMQRELPVRGMDECLAYKLVFFALYVLRADPHRSERVYRDLDAQFRAKFGRPVPCRPGGPDRRRVGTTCDPKGSL
jgi:hypothetical protein